MKNIVAVILLLLKGFFQVEHSGDQFCKILGARSAGNLFEFGLTYKYLTNSRSLLQILFLCVHPRPDINHPDDGRQPTKELHLMEKFIPCRFQVI